eukprot:scaffold8401_cov74-Phaeocystis_antarctica.AAC.1
MPTVQLDPAETATIQEEPTSAQDGRRSISRVVPRAAVGQSAERAAPSGRLRAVKQTGIARAALAGALGLAELVQNVRPQAARRGKHTAQALRAAERGQTRANERRTQHGTLRQKASAQELHDECLLEAHARGPPAALPKLDHAARQLGVQHERYAGATCSMAVRLRREEHGKLLAGKRGHSSRALRSSHTPRPQVGHGWASPRLPRARHLDFLGRTAREPRSRAEDDDGAVGHPPRRAADHEPQHPLEPLPGVLS